MNQDEKLVYFGRDLEAMSFAVNYHNWILDEFKPYIGKSVAEIGAGTGNFTELLLKKNPGIQRLFCFEPSENMYPTLKKKMASEGRVKTENGYFNDQYEESKKGFDSIIYTNVLEHVEHDQQELKYMHGSLKSGGYALVFVPAISWLYSDLDKHLGHFRRYHMDELTYKAEQAGFEVVSVKYFDLLGMLPWYVVFVLMGKTLTGDKVSIYDRVAVPIMRVLETWVTPPIGKNLLMICRKK